MKVLINSRMRIRYAPQGIIVLEYRAKGLWGYCWKPVAYTLANKDEKPEHSLYRLQVIRLRKVIDRRKVINELVLACLKEHLY